jgi:hypothetical protein
MACRIAGCVRLHEVQRDSISAPITGKTWPHSKLLNLMPSYGQFMEKA